MRRIGPLALAFGTWLNAESACAAWRAYDCSSTQGHAKTLVQCQGLNDCIGSNPDWEYLAFVCESGFCYAAEADLTYNQNTRELAQSGRLCTGSRE